MAAPDPDTAKAVVENGPFVAKNILPTLWMVMIASISGCLSFYHKVRDGKSRAFNITELIGEIVTSAIVGLVTYWLCKGLDVNEYLTAAGVAITGHMGARAIFIAEQWIEKRSDSIKP